MALGSIFIADYPWFSQPNERVEVAGYGLGTIERVENNYVEGKFKNCRVYVRWDKGVELGSYRPKEVNSG